MTKTKSIYTDVLIVGSGGAGLRAALEARTLGVQVLIASKSPLGVNTCTIYSAGGFKAGLGGPTTLDFFKKALRWGRSINNQKLLKVFAEEGASRLLELEKLGVHVIPRVGGCWVTGPPPMFGKGLTDPLKATALRTGVKVLERVMVTDLAIADGRLTGALALDSDANLITIESKSAILASGGGCQVYSKTDNPRGITGDGYAIALRAGARLLDMEFVQFSPLGIAEPDMPTSLVLIPSSTLINSLGEKIVEKYKLTKGEPSDTLARAIEREVSEGRGTNRAVLADLTKIPDTFWKEQNNHTKNLTWLLRKHANKQVLHIFPLAHYFLGGVLIDDKCQTNIPGLYAAGEVTGGIHGANRVPGNALTELIVFGARAGRFAAEYANKTAEKPHIDPRFIAEKSREILDIGNGTVPPKTLRKRIHEVMWKFLGIVRNEEGVKKAIEELKEVKVQTKAILAKNRAELIEALEVKNMCQVAEMLALASQFRTESRGSHYRSDYPTQDDSKWLNNVIITLKGERVELIKKPVILNSDS